MRNQGRFALIIDDDQDTQLLVSAIVRIAGYEARSTDNLDCAIEALGDGPAVILLDLVMPDKICDRIGQLLAQRESLVPVVLMSAHGAEQLESKRRELVALGVIAPVSLRKPFWSDELLEAFAEIWPAAGERETRSQAWSTGSAFSDSQDPLP